MEVALAQEDKIPLEKALASMVGMRLEEQALATMAGLPHSEEPPLSLTLIVEVGEALGSKIIGGQLADFRKAALLLMNEETRTKEEIRLPRLLPAGTITIEAQMVVIAQNEDSLILEVRTVKTAMSLHPSVFIILQTAVKHLFSIY